jgi:hypothetical protein
MIIFLKAEEQHQHKNGGGWVANTATVAEAVYVGPYAQVYGNARVYGKAQVSGNARVFGKAQVSGNAQVYGNAWVYGKAQVSGNAWVFGNAWVYGKAQVSGNAWVFGNAWETSPLYIQGSRHSMTNCAYGYIAIGCHVHTFAEWKKEYKDIGKQAGYTPAQIKEYAAYIALVIKHGKKATKKEKQ